MIMQEARCFAIVPDTKVEPVIPDFKNNTIYSFKIASSSHGFTASAFLFNVFNVTSLNYTEMMSASSAHL